MRIKQRTQDQRAERLLPCENGDKYSGQIDETGLAHGFGILRRTDGTRASGVWEHGRFVGEYEGETEAGMKQGRGSMRYADGGVYEGAWLEDKRHGQGKMTYPSGDQYEGRWEDDQPWGLGTRGEHKGCWRGSWYTAGCDWPESGRAFTVNGDVCDWDNNNRGKLVYKNGNVFEGEFKGLFEPSFGKMVYAGGDVYNGYLKYGKRNGFGEMTYANGDVRGGFWENDKMQGFGSCWGSLEWEGLWHCDARYEGEVEEGVPHGRGKLFYSDGSVRDGLWYQGGYYEGEIRDGVPNGKGKCRWESCDILENQSCEYEGDWQNGKPVKGKVVFVTGSVYNGEVDECTPHGVGEMKEHANDSVTQNEFRGRWENGRLVRGYVTKRFDCGVYRGEMEHGKRHGLGRMNYYNSNYREGEWVRDRFVSGKGRMTFFEKGEPVTYEGQLKGNMRHGTGTTNQCDGEWQNNLFIGVYEGEKMYGKPHGDGTMIYADDERVVYTGEWRFGKYHGKGRLTLVDGEVYDGQWVAGVRQGRGKLTKSDGSVYVGDFLTDKPDGIGKRTNINGDYVDGVWICGEFVRGAVRLTATDGVYVGQQEEGKRHGKGKIENNDGSVWEGVWYCGGRFEGDLFNGVIHGHGTCSYPDGSVYEGWWRDGLDTQGYITYPDGNKYAGDVREGKPYGYGKMITQTNELTGCWVRGKFMSGQDCCVCLEKKNGWRSICGDDRHVVCPDCFARIERDPCPVCRQRA